MVNARRVDMLWVCGADLHMKKSAVDCSTLNVDGILQISSTCCRETDLWALQSAACQFLLKIVISTANQQRIGGFAVGMSDACVPTLMDQELSVFGINSQRPFTQRY